MKTVEHLGKSEAMANYSEGYNAQIKVECGVTDLSIKLSPWSEALAHRSVYLLEKQ